MKSVTFKFSMLLVAIFLFNFSCQDHVVPENPDPQTPEEIMPVIHTPGLTIENSSANLYRLKVNFTNLGNQPIIEHGVVYSVEPDNGSQNFTNTPTISNSKSVFPEVPSLKERIKITEIDLTTAKQLYYRAYAIYGNNKVVYGEVLVYDPKLAIVEAGLNLSLNKPYQTAYEIQDFGKSPVKEFGMVYSYRPQANANINAFPTTADNKVIALSGPLTLKGLGTVNLPISENTVLEIYARTYVEYTNGKIQYGNNILHAK
ncbi:hypothetical protein [Dyadobacter sp. CY326]|uniref:hypothetical protein n=1 Tax=Dyadobacter sp. CY326 TaxID=2907300 RepID=UPI001F1CF1B4|nr:hypothetical protein [Dyadobacter sp. CY326]MCE7066887.1 hypothetical protein [Dyadobacter sp. CY326]